MFWRKFHKKFGKEEITKLSIPSEFLGNFKLHYFLYDESGIVRDGARTMFSAIKKAKKSGLYISRCWD